MKSSNSKRVLAAFTAGAYLFTVLGAARAEASFWEDRALARRSENRHETSANVWLAQLPTAVKPLLGVGPTPVPRSTGASVPGPDASPWVQGLATPHADVRSVWEGAARGPRVVLVLDAHDVESAQRNIAGFLRRMQRALAPVVGVEGTSGAFVLERYRNLLAPAPQRALMEHLLKKGFLNGVEYFALLEEDVPALWGVEDPALYEGNVRAYRNALSEQDAVRAALGRLFAAARQRSSERFAPPLRAFLGEVNARHEDRGDAGRYAEKLAEILVDAVGPQTRAFLRAKRLEEGLSFPEVEQARAAFIERVSPRLSPAETQALVRLTADFRAGALSARAYYDRLERAAAAKGVPVAAYPPFHKYIEYVAAADAVDPTELMEEWDASEERAVDRLARPEDRPLIDWWADLRLIERAVGHALTPTEWDRYQQRNVGSGWRERGLAAEAPAEDLDRVCRALPLFEEFFKAADARNVALLDNLLAEARRRGALDAVLVTGGFHAPALRGLLRSRGLSHAVVAPVVTDVPEDGAGYLQAFAPTRTPLERLLLGDRLFLNPPSATSAGVRDPASPYHDAATALDRAAVVYGAPLAQGSSWRTLLKRLGDKMSITQEVRQGRRTVQVRFRGAAQSVVIAAPVAGETATGESLARSVEEKGARVLETGTVGDVPYALGGKPLFRVLPELLAGAGFLLWFGASSLSPPALLWGVGAGAVAGGMALRGLVLGSIFIHGAGHAAQARMEKATSFRAALGAYARSLGGAGVIPFSTIFLPGLSPETSAPKMSLGVVSEGAARRAALAGPLANLTAAALVAPLLTFTGPMGATDLVLAAFAGVNLWTALASVSDWRTAFSGMGRVLACGVVGVVYGGPNAKAETLPSGVRLLMDEGIARTLHRGGQSGGVAAVAVRENGHAEYSFFIEKTAKERDRRARLGQLMRDGMSRLAVRAQKAGFGGLRRLVVIGHTRYGTNLAQPIAANAHPHTGAGNVDEIFYLGDAKKEGKYERPWERPGETPILKSAAMPRGVAIAHNGDDNATTLFRRGDRSIVFSNDDDARLSERTTGFKNPAQGDSPQIATRFDRWITQGSVRASMRLALLTVSLENIAASDPSAEDVLSRAPTPRVLDGLLQAQVFAGFPVELKTLQRHHPAAKHWDALFAAAGARGVSEDAFWDLEEAVAFDAGSDLDRLRQGIAEQGRSVLKGLPWFGELDEAAQARTAGRFADLFLKHFFTGDLRRAGLHLLRRADPTSTFGLMAGTLLEGESALWLRQRQPFYLWMSDDGKSVAGSSEAKAFLGARAGESPFRHRLTLKNGEVATLRGARLVIDHIERGRVAEYDLSRPTDVWTDPR